MEMMYHKNHEQKPILCLLNGFHVLESCFISCTSECGLDVVSNDKKTIVYGLPWVMKCCLTFFCFFVVLPKKLGKDLFIVT